MSRFSAWRHRTRRAPDAAVALGVADAGVDAFGAIPHEEERPSYPLSFAQERMWFLSQLDPSSSAYNCPHTVRFVGRLNPAALEASVQEIVRRHEVLRTSFGIEDGRPVQRVRPAARTPMTLVDLRHLPDGTRRAEALRLGRAEGARPFDLAHDALLRVTLVRLDDDEHLALFTMHHIVADDWSIGVFSAGLAECYQAYLGGRRAPGDELQVQYRDFAVWQRERAEGEEIVRQRAYWLDRLRDLPVLALRTDRPRPNVQAHRGSKQFLSIPRALAGRLRQTSERERATLFMTLLAALQVLLLRHSGQRDLPVGVPIAGRTRVELEPLVGFFLNTLVMRTRIVGNPSFRALLRDVRETALDAYACQDVPFEQLVERLQPERDLSYHPLFQVMLVHQQRPPVRVHLPDLTIETLDTGGDTAKFDLTFMVTESDSGLSLSIEYDTVLFDDESIAGLKDRFLVLLESIGEDADCGVLDLEIMPAAERAALVESWSGPDVDYLRAASTYELFEEQVARTPDATALVDGERYVTYRALRRRAEELAARLAAAGIGPEKRVGLHVERSAESVIAMLGVLRSGGAYVPLDPAYPRERLHDLASYAVLDAIVSSTERPWAGLGVPVVYVDLPEGGGPEVDGAAPAAVCPDNPAYVMYTSGSTARPKAVVGLHRGLMNRLLWMSAAAPLADDDVCCHRTSLAFVDSICEVFGPLLGGARLVVVRQHEARDVETLVQAIAAEQMTRVTVVPSLLRVMMDVCAGAGRPPDALRLCVSSGEPLSGDDIVRYRRAFPGSRLLNLYGTTEISADVTYSFSTDEAPDRRNVSIGRPMQNTRVYLLDEDGRVVAPGVTGEVIVGGEGLARGYLHAPDLTAERFVPDAIAPAEGARVYRTGDLGYVTADGSVQLRGRMDLQVKLRGHRIDPAEVETVLARHPNVRESVVVLAGDGGHLFAYYVARGEAPEAAALRAFLRARIPEYLVPSRFVRLDAMPNTPSGKIARPALPPPGPLQDEDALAPRTPLEARMAAVWSDVLDVRPVGIRSNFFALGGHSLLAAQLVYRLRTELGRHIPLRALFEAPTVEELAARLQGESPGASARDPLPAIAPDLERRHEPFPLTDMQQAYWAGRTQALSLGSVSIHGYMELEAEHLDVERFAAAWRLLVRRHDMLRAVVLPDGRQRILEEVPGYEIPVRVLRGSANAIEAQLEEIRAEMSHQVLPLEQWPPFDIRATVLDGAVRLHLSIDTFFLDGWSQQLLVRELLQAYADPDAMPPAPALSFRDYVLAQQSLLGTPEYRRALDEWRERLARLVPAPDLPLARRPETLAKTEFRKLAASLDADACARLQERARAAGLSLPHALIGAYGRVLARWSTGAKLAVNVPTFNRLPFHPDVNRLVGAFSGFTVVELDPAGAGLEALARQARDELSWALDHQVVSGVRLMRELVQRDGFRIFLPVVFTSLGFDLDRGTARRPAPALPGLREVYSVAQTPQVWLDNRVGYAHGDVLTIEWDVVDELFPPGMIDDMFTAYCDVVRAMADDPRAWKDDARLSLPASQRALLAQANATTGPEWNERLEAGFLAQVRRQPAAAAVVAADRTLTYAEVSRRAEGVAEALRAAGAGPDALVGVVTESGWEPVVAVLGVLRAGAAYLPVDAEVPDERLAWLLGDGDVRVVATQTSVAARHAWPPGVAVVCVDAVPEAPADGIPGEEPAGDVDALAYVIYTSGSTGRPKGVMMPHRAAVNTVRDVAQRCGLGPGDRLLALSALSFDLSVFDVFGTLGAGATLVMPAPGARRDPRSWWELAGRAGVTVWNSVPALLGLLVEFAETTDAAARGPGIGTLRLAMLSGDWIPVRLPAAVRALAPDCQVMSLGGPTETAIWSVSYPIGEVDQEWKSIPYGRPLTNQRVYVLNASGEVCPVWVPGEMYIGGAGLARGYWKDDARTAVSFITHPDLGERLYRTGDRGRFLPDGTIEILGRVDTQLKLHGYRIEPAEIESVLLQHPGVQAAAVVPSETPGGDRHLVAYVVRRRSPAASAGAGVDAERAEALKKLEFRLRQPGVRRLGDTFERVNLPAPQSDGDAYLARRSHRRFRREPMTVEALASMLACLRQHEVAGFPLPKYRYASAGNLYPVQAYVYLKPAAVAGLTAGYYYYDPREHRLVRMSDARELEAARFGSANEAVFESAAFAIFLIAQMEAIAPIYGDVSARFAALEAGLMTQLLEMTAGASDVGLCQIGGVDFTGLEGRLGLEASHVLVHVVVGGPRRRDADGWDGFRRDAELGGPRTSSNDAAPAGHTSDAALFAELRGRLKAALPHYMVPSVIVGIDRLPTSANGKVDRAKLPKVARLPERRQPGGGPAPLEAVLAEMWAQVLQVPEVGPEDGFFELGGSSLTAISLATMINEALGVAVPITRFLEAPTVAALAALVEEMRGPAADDQGTALPLAAPDPASRHEPFPLTDIQQAYWIGRTAAMPLGEVGTHSYAEIDFAALDVTRLSDAFERLIARHDMLRAVIGDDGRQRILARVPPHRIPCIDCRGTPHAVVQAMLHETRARMSHQVFAVGEWPLFELCVHRLEDRDRLHISADLTMADAWSVQILRRELLSLYEEPGTPSLPPLEFSFRDYVLAARALESSPQFGRARSYWLDRLAELPPPPQLPLRGSIGLARRPGFSRLQGSLDPGMWSAFRSAASRRRVTPSGALCTAFARVVAAWSEAPQFTLNLTTFGRLPLHPDVHALVGDFTATTLLAVDMSDRSFERSAARVQRQIWSDLEHRLFGGVRVLREKSRRQGRVGAALGPVVFTSMLAHGADAQGTASTLGGRLVYSVSQTPQVLLDHQVAEYEGRLTYSWDFVSALFAEGVVEAMFEAYRDLLSRLATGENGWVE